MSQSLIRSGQASLDLLIEELAGKLQAGELVDVEAFLVDHPEHAERLRQLWPTLEALARLGPSLGSDSCGLPAAAGTAPEALGDFRILREVGRGGMGIVYEAEQMSLGRRVALKVLPFAATMDPRHLHRFQNEARAAASLEHPHIVPVYGVGCERGVHYYAMKFIEGQSLAGLIAAQHQPSELQPSSEPRPTGRGGTQLLPVGRGSDSTSPVAALSTQRAPRDSAAFRQIAEWGIQAAEALEHAHSVGIVHRDIKPANLMIDSRGVLWVADFGLARSAADAGLTMTGDVIGTLRYMSPEQAMAKHGLVDHRTDIYSLGVTLYELLVGRPAVGGKDREEILNAITLEEPRPPRALDSAMPPELETIVLKAMEKDAAERYATARELADDLRRFLNNQPIRARCPSMAQRCKKWAQRHKPLVWSGAAMAFLASTGLGASTLLLWQEEERTAAALRQSQANYALAEEQRHVARRAVDDMYTQVAEQWLGKQPQLTEVQRGFLLKALHYYQEAMKEHGTDPEVRKGVYEAAERVGRIQHQLGEHGEAEQSFRQALTLAQGLADDFPDEAKYHYNVAIVHKLLADLLDDIGQCTEAEREYRQGLAILKHLVADFPDDRNYRKALGGLYNNLGELLRKLNQPRQAEDAFRQAVDSWDQTAAHFPGEPELLMSSAKGHTNLANALKGSSPKEADQHGRKALRVLQNLVAEHPEDRDYRYHLGAAYYTLSLILDPRVQPREVAHAVEAVQCRREAVAAFQKLADDFPRVLEYRRRLALAQGALGALLVAEQQPGSAAQVLGQAVESYGLVVKDAPGVPDYRSELAHFRQTLGDLLFRTGQVQKAEQQFREVRRLDEELVRDFPTVVNYRANLAVLLLTCPIANLRDAGRAVEQAQKITEFVPDLRDAWQLLGMAHYRAGNWEASRTALLKAEKLPEGYGPSWIFLAMAEWRLGHKEEARRWYDKAVRWTEENAPRNEELRAYRAEAADLLKITDNSSSKPE